MIFSVPCFVCVEDAAERQKLIEWLRSVGYEDFGNPFQSFSYIIYTTVDGYYVNAQASIDNSWIDAGTSIELFKALAAMNDENDREQWFVVDDGFEEEMVCSKSEVDYDYILSCYDHRKATVEEIVEYFEKRSDGD